MKKNHSIFLCMFLCFLLTITSCKNNEKQQETVTEENTQEPAKVQQVSEPEELEFDKLNMMLVMSVAITNDFEHAYVCVSDEFDAAKISVYMYTKEGDKYANPVELQIQDGVVPTDIFLSKDGTTVLFNVMTTEEMESYLSECSNGSGNLYNHKMNVAKMDIKEDGTFENFTYVDAFNKSKVNMVVSVEWDESILYKQFDSENVSYLMARNEDGIYKTEVYSGAWPENGLDKVVFIGDGSECLFTEAVAVGTDYYTMLAYGKTTDDSWDNTVIHNIINDTGCNINCISVIGDDDDDDDDDDEILIYQTVNYTTMESHICKCSADIIRNNDNSIQLDENAASYSTEYNEKTFTETTRTKSDEEEKEGVYYEIFVRSFADSNNDGIGDLNGITAKLDYLEDLGVDGLWLSPIFDTDSKHGYDVKDYTKVASDLGTSEDLKTLLDEAHSRDMKVMLDLPVNHTSCSCEWFEEAITNPESKYAGYYRIVNSEDTDQYDTSEVSSLGNQVWHQNGNCYYYGIFSSEMPDLNYNNQDVRDEIKNIAKQWLEFGVDGYRLDGALHIYGDYEFTSVKDKTKANIQWWNEFACACEEVNPDVYLVGEVWQDDEVLEEYAQPFDSKFEFSYRDSLIKALTKNTATIGDFSMATAYKELLDAYESEDSNYLNGLIVDNHDTNRISSDVDDIQKVKLAAAVQLTLKGNPFIYYGDELGMEGEGIDTNSRSPFLWGDSKEESCYLASSMNQENNTETESLEEQQKNASSVYNTYKILLKIRKECEALNSGDYEVLDVKNEVVMAYKRFTEDETVYVLHNFSNEQLTIDLSAIDSSLTSAKTVYQRGDKTAVKRQVITIAAYGSIIIK